MSDFYVYEVLNDYKDTLIFNDNINNNFIKGERFIGYSLKSINFVVKSNLKELITIPKEYVKKIYKVEIIK